MLGMISPNIRLISIDWGIDYYAIKANFDRPENDDDFELLKSISIGVATDFPQAYDFMEYAEYSLVPFDILKDLIILGIKV